MTKKKKDATLSPLTSLSRYQRQRRKGPGEDGGSMLPLRPILKERAHIRPKVNIWARASWAALEALRENPRCREAMEAWCYW
jgi:hypothetical protein